MPCGKSILAVRGRSSVCLSRFCVERRVMRLARVAGAKLRCLVARALAVNPQIAEKGARRSWRRFRPVPRLRDGTAIDDSRATDGALKYAATTTKSKAPS